MSYRIYSAVLLSLSFVANAHEQTTTDKFTPILNLGGRYLHSQLDYPVARLANAQWYWNRSSEKLSRVCQRVGCGVTLWRFFSRMTVT